MKTLTSREIESLAVPVALGIDSRAGEKQVHLVGIPRGGVSVAYLIASMMRPQTLDKPPIVRALGEPAVYPSNETFVAVVDDVCTSGQTLFRAGDPDLFGVLVNKSEFEYMNGVAIVSGTRLPMDPEWVQFPWEINDTDEGRPEDAVRRLIEYVGDDPARPGLVETPARVLRFLDELRERSNGGWHPTAFESSVDDMLMVRDIPLYSMCEHHMLPWFGSAHVAYIPSGKILGLSKVARTVAQLSSRLTVQEELSRAVAKRISEYSGSPDVGVVTTGIHTCMLMRGVQAHGSSTLSSAMLGKFRNVPEARAEFLNLIGGR